ncbi:MAG: hypothetical protein WDN76_12825 [Alphaproteobacteria bacterium]
MILSSYGLREGLLYEHLSPRSRASHPLIAAAEAFGAPSERARAFGAALEKWDQAGLFQTAAGVQRRAR